MDQYTESRASHSQSSEVCSIQVGEICLGYDLTKQHSPTSSSMVDSCESDKRSILSAMIKYPEMWSAIATSTTFMAVLLIVGSMGWVGEDDPCLQDGQCFCEMDRGGLIRTPANTTSNVGYIISGVLIGYLSGRRRIRQSITDVQGQQHNDKNLMTSTIFYPCFYANLVANVGPASMALHASLKHWGGFIDVVAFSSLLVYIFAYTAIRLIGKLNSKACFVAIFLLIDSLILFVKMYFENFSRRRAAIFVTLSLSSLVMELLHIWRGRLRVQIRWLVVFASCFIAGLLCQNFSQTDGPLCFAPSSFFQVHGLWHAFTAAAAFVLYFYACSETNQHVDQNFASDTDSEKLENGGPEKKDNDSTLSIVA